MVGFLTSFQLCLILLSCFLCPLIFCSCSTFCAFKRRNDCFDFHFLHPSHRLIMSQLAYEFRKEKERLLLQISTLQGEISTLQYAKYSEQLEYQQQIGALNENMSGKFCVGFCYPIYLQIYFSVLQANLHTAENKVFMLQAQLAETNLLTGNQASVSAFQGNVTDVLLTLVNFLKFVSSHSNLAEFQ